MKKIWHLALLLFLFIWADKAFAQQPSPNYVLRLVNSSDKSGDKLAERTLDASLKSLHNSSRVDVLFDGNPNAAATHLLEAGSSYSVVKDEFLIKHFIDSTQTILLTYNYTVQGRVEILATEVETGLVAGRTALVTNGEAEKEFKVEFKKVGWAKGMDKEDKKLREGVIEKAQGIFNSQLPAIQNSAKEALVKNMGGISRNAHYKLFPYRAVMLEATEVKGDKAKTVKIDAGKMFDLLKGDEMVIYSIREIKSGDKVYEHFDMLGRVSTEKISEKDGLFDVERGKKEILEAMNAKKAVYASPEKPYTISKSGSGLNIAIASFLTPKDFTTKNREEAYRRLRFNLMSKQGYNLIERANLSALNNEKEMQKQENFIDKAVVDQYKSVGADLLLEVICTEVLNEQKQSYEDGSLTSARVSIDYLLRLVDVETGEVVGEKKVPFSKYYSNGVNEQNQVLAQSNKDRSHGKDFILQDALKGFNVNPSAFLDEMLPPSIIVSEVTDEKKDRADEVLVVGDFDFKSLDKWNVVRKRIVNVEGKELIRFEPIGIVSFREQQGNGVVNAKVKDGGDKILTAMKAGEVLYVMDKPNWAERWSSSYLYKHGY